MSGQIIRHDSAKEDLAQQVDYLAGQSPQAARHFAQAVEEALERLSEMPELEALASSATQRPLDSSFASCRDSQIISLSIGHFRMGLR
jgi:plasmid stabilization system protein ParE